MVGTTTTHSFNEPMTQRRIPNAIFHYGVNPVRSSQAELDVLCPFQSSQHIHANKAL